MRHASRLLTVGEVNPDVVVQGVPNLRFGQAEDVIRSTQITLGGSATIMACGAARLGATVDLVGVVGDDEFGRFMLRELSVTGVSTEGIRVIPGRRTGSSVVLVAADDPADRQILTDLGTMADLEPGDISDEILGRSSHLHIGSWFLHLSARHRLVERLAAARGRGMSTSVDPNDDPERIWDGGLQDALGQIELLFCNGAEARGLSGLEDDDAAARSLLTRLAPTSGRRGLPAVVLKLGAGGARLYQSDGVTSVGAPPVVVVDTIGAGDSLAGAVLAALLDDEPWPEALALGVASGSLSTTRAGGTSAQPNLAQARQQAATLEIHHMEEHCERDLHAQLPDFGRD